MAYLENNLLLTIAIPTYNRSNFLDQALLSIYNQIGDKADLIEIIVSDNNSSDNTTEVVNQHIRNGLPINYVKNDVNKGADFNISQCFKLANGKFVLTFGDDDKLLNGTIDKIIAVIKEYPDFGILYLNWRLISDGILAIDEKSPVLMFNDYEDFLKKISHNITFISGNVVNKKFVKDIYFEKYFATSLIQLPFFLTAVLNSPYNLYFQEPSVAVPVNNSGGYSICTVFGSNINQIFQEYSTDEKRKRTFKAIKDELLTVCFPGWIKRLKSSGHKFTDVEIHKVLKPIYKDNLNYWIYNYPLIIQPGRMLNITWPVYTLYSLFITKVLKKRVRFKYTIAKI
ncbi:glycosyltransferase family A protein [Pedobacter sp. MC2016-15]|uniref:glycosyltransferase family 2 protein n=1 Tax=Pedobacter sp. MC2016-15 TaxID=2994473 RepID=UPI002247880F|nr:glycosyltransferase family A protein [Pedobacter sp. MC2016-15]MCX2481802.1 glycosyltransferase family A protein [Pedobacter sp. MC2016-15]